MKYSNTVVNKPLSSSTPKSNKCNNDIFKAVPKRIGQFDFSWTPMSAGLDISDSKGRYSSEIFTDSALVRSSGTLLYSEKLDSALASL
jgi:hypothetical protein